MLFAAIEPKAKFRLSLMPIRNVLPLGSSAVDRAEQWRLEQYVLPRTDRIGISSLEYCHENCELDLPLA